MTENDYLLGEELWVMMQRIATLNNEMFKDVNLGYSQYSALMYIGQEEGLSIKRLAELQSVEKSTAGKSVQRLERKGLVLRKQNSEDKRESLLFPTPDGYKLLPDLNRIYMDFLARILSPLSGSEREQYRCLTEKINRSIR